MNKIMKDLKIVGVLGEIRNVNLPNIG